MLYHRVQPSFPVGPVVWSTHSHLLLSNCSAVEKQLFQILHLKLWGLKWAYSYSLLMCLNFSSSGVVKWLQSSWLGGRHLREETCWQSAADLESCSLKLFWRSGKISRQQEEDFKCCIMSCRFLSLIGSNSVMVLELVLDGQNDSTPPVPGTVALTACLVSWILAVKNDANSLHALVGRCLEAVGTGGFVSLSKVANNAQALFLFLVMMSKKKTFSILN